MPYRRVKPDAPRDRWGHVSGDPHHNFLRSRQWQKIRAAFLSAHPLCEHCGLLGRTTAATTADHIERLVDSDHFKRTSWGGACRRFAPSITTRKAIGSVDLAGGRSTSAPTATATTSSSSAATSRRLHAQPSSPYTASTGKLDRNTGSGGRGRHKQTSPNFRYWG